MILLALDASTTAVGWAVFEDGDYRVSGVYLPPAEAKWWWRVWSVGNWLGTLLARKRAHVLAYELATGNQDNMHTNRLLGAVEYEVRFRAIQAYRPSCEFVTVTASQVKASGCHKGALEVAKQIKGGPLDNDNPGDEADAIGVALVALGKIKEASWT